MTVPPSQKDAKYLRGLIMTLITTVLWGVLPIFLKIALKEISPGSIAWFRFSFAFVLLLVLLTLNGSRPAVILKRPPLLGLIGGAALAGNYYWVTQGVQLSSPSNVAVLIQIAPVLLVVAGVFGFKERVTPRQVVGMTVAMAGFYLFFRDQSVHTGNIEIYSLANVHIVIAAVAWVVYMICQKALSRSFGAQSLNLLVYGTAAVTLVSQVTWSDFPGLDAGCWGTLLFLGLNTLLAYGALAEAVKCISLVFISILLALNPLITLMGMRVLSEFAPGWVTPETVGSAGYMGAGVAVLGVVMVVVRR